eukprot:SAG31_NODE_8318_length_1475_cov_1.461483_1_plen_46_part_01
MKHTRSDTFLIRYIAATEETPETKPQIDSANFVYGIPLADIPNTAF